MNSVVRDLAQCLTGRWDARNTWGGSAFHTDGFSRRERERERERKYIVVALQALLDTALRFSVSARLARFKIEYEALHPDAAAAAAAVVTGSSPPR